MSANPPEDRGVMVVTGGTRGIGAATSRRAAAGGWRVLMVYRDRDADAAALAASIRASGGHAEAFRADIADEASIVRVFEAADRLGALSRAGEQRRHQRRHGSRVESLQADRSTRCCAVNVRAPFLCCARGGQADVDEGTAGGAARSSTWLGRVAAGLARRVGPLRGEQGRARHDDGRAREGGGGRGHPRERVRPGMIDTEIHAARPPGQLEQLARTVPMGRIGTADEIARAIVWLADEPRAYVTATLLDARGGI